MTVEEAIVYALEGSAILFLGSGFSKGAKNTDNKEFPVGDDLCKRLIEDGRIDTAEDSESDIRDLGYISDRYLEKNTKRDLLKFLRNKYYIKFYNGFTSDEKRMFLWYCIEMQNKIQKYLTSSRISERRNRKRAGR